MLQKNIFVQTHDSLTQVLKRLDITADKVLLVVDEDRRLLGTITDGDIRRHLLIGSGLQGDISQVYNENPRYMNEDDYSLDLAKRIFLAENIQLLPIVDASLTVINHITWNQAFSGTGIEVSRGNIQVPVVIMAGGKGTRLEPFTKILPKPLIPVGEKTIAETIIDEFRKQGAREYYLTLNYKGEMIEAYFKSVEKSYSLDYIWEKSFYGTAGCLSLLKSVIKGTFIVTNCDVIVKADFRKVIDMHEREQASLTVLSSIQHYKIPYGVISFKNGGEVTEIQEKPEYTFTINTGIYILSREVLDYIPDDAFMDMTELIDTLIAENKKVITYPVNERDYIDIGQWDEYKKAVTIFENV